MPADHIFGTEFEYDSNGRIESITRATAGYGKVVRLEQLQAALKIGPDHLIYAGDGSSDMHAMLHVNDGDGLTIAVSQSRKVTAVAQRTVLSNNALAMLVPIFEKVAAVGPAADPRFLRAQWLPRTGVGEGAHRLADVESRDEAGVLASQAGSVAMSLLSWIGWIATAVFSTSYFFKGASTLRWIQAGAATAVGHLWPADPRDAGGGGERDRGGGGGVFVPRGYPRAKDSAAPDLVRRTRSRTPSRRRGADVVSATITAPCFAACLALCSCSAPVRSRWNVNPTPTIVRAANASRKR